MAIYYVETTNPALVIRVPGNTSGGPVIAVPARPGLEFSLISPITKNAMREARRCASQNGVKIITPNRVAVTFE